MNFLQTEWNLIPREYYRNLIKSMNNRIEAVIAANGNVTPYYSYLSLANLINGLPTKFLRNFQYVSAVVVEICYFIRVFIEKYVSLQILEII